MAQTAGGTYYAASSELVSSWPATSLDLANQLESRFAAKLGTLSVNAQTGTTYTLTTSDPQKVITMTNAAASSVTIPTNATAAIAIGSAVEIVNLSTGVNTTVSAAGGVTFNGGPVVLSPGSSVTLVKIGTDAWMAQGQGSPGLVHIATTTFSAANSVSINNCFTSAYDNYQIVMFLAASTAAALDFRLRASGTDNSSAVYTYVYADTGAAAQTGASVTFWRMTANLGTIVAPSTITVMRPAIAASTSYIGDTYRSADNYRTSGAGTHSGATAFDGFSLIPSTGNVTGTLRIYAYRS